MVNSKVGRRETTTDDVDAYDLIMKNKELLLDRDPKRSPVRFIFSHSALREGWDNPNVFQICTLKQSGSDVRKRQEVGRGLRLCVNQDGERQDANVLGNDVHNINILTVIASESYDSFAKGLQSEIAEAVADRPRAITVDLFVGKVIKDSSGHEQVIDKDIADAIMYDLIINRYIDKKGALTDKYYEEKANGTLQVAEEVADCAASVVEIIGSIYDPKTMQPENARSNNVELHVDEEKIAMPEFKALWSKINAKSVYIVDFDTDELVQKAIASLDAKLRVAKIFFSKVPDWDPRDGFLPIQTSCRYSQEIADAICKLKTGNKEILTFTGNTGIKPVLIVFDPKKIDRVLGGFISALETHGLHDCQGIYKAVAKIRLLRSNVACADLQ